MFSDYFLLFKNSFTLFQVHHLWCLYLSISYRIISWKDQIFFQCFTLFQFHSLDCETVLYTWWQNLVSWLEMKNPFEFQNPIEFYYCFLWDSLWVLHRFSFIIYAILYRQSFLPTYFCNLYLHIVFAYMIDVCVLSQHRFSPVQPNLLIYKCSALFLPILVFIYSVPVHIFFGCY